MSPAFVGAADNIYRLACHVPPEQGLSLAEARQLQPIEGSPLVNAKPRAPELRKLVGPTTSFQS